MSSLSQPTSSLSLGGAGAISSEYMLRRKTPSGTLAAGYDGTPVEWPSRPHASKYMLLPASSTGVANTYPHFANIDRPMPRMNTGYGPSVNSFQGQPQSMHDLHENNYVKTDSIAGLESDLLWNSKCTPPAGVDSVLNQSSLYNQQYRLAGEHQVPGILQPMWPPSLGATSHQMLGNSGYHWPDASFEAYRPFFRPEGLLDHKIETIPEYPQYSDRLLPNHPIFPTEHHRDDHTPLNHGTIQDHHHPARSHDPSDARHHASPSDLVYLENYATGRMPNAQNRSSLAVRGRSDNWDARLRPSNLDHAYSNLRVSSIESPSSIHRGRQEPENFAGHAQFKEKVLGWAYRIYGNLLATIEQERRHANQDQASGHGHSTFHPHPPRRPYPTWSSNHFRDKDRRGASSTPLHIPINGTGISQGFDRAMNTSANTMGSPFPSKMGSFPSNAGPPSTSAQNWYSSHLKNGLNAAQASYVPPQLTQDRNQNTPASAAMSAMEMLSRLCEESKWTWTDGMVLNGCLAYGLGNYNKAMRMFSKVLQNQSHNVEAMSNLAATLTALDRKQEAELYWLRSVKLRPGYFEAVEHLVGLLHESQRGKEAVKIVEHVEQALREDIAMSGRDRFDNSSFRERYHSLRDPNLSGYKIPPSDNGRLLALIHGKGNILYQMGDNGGAAKAFEEAILIGAGKTFQGIQSLIQDILRSFSDDLRHNNASIQTSFGTDEPLLLPPDMALETSLLVFPPDGRLPGLEKLPDGINQKAAISIVSNSLLSLAKIYQDGMSSSGASATAPRATSGVQEILALYYLSLSLQPSPSTANNVGILLAGVQQSARSRMNPNANVAQSTSVPGVIPGSGVALALAYYDYGLKLDPKHAHLYTNLGSLFKDIGQLNAAIRMYEKAVECDGNFDIALANLANAVKDKGEIGQAINYYKRAVTANPDFAEAVCGLANALNSVCMWSGRGGISPSSGSRDRWHVDENGVLFDSKSNGMSKSGWIERVVAIVDKQLLDGQSWGQRILQSVGIDALLTQISQAFSHPKDHSQARGILQKALESWSGDIWEGTKVVRLVERATKRLGWQLYQDRYVYRRSSRQQTRLRPQLPAALAIPSAPTVLPFHTFTCPLSAKQIRQISQRNGLRVSCSTLRSPWLPAHIFEPPAPPEPNLIVGYVSSDFNNHPLAHLMQSVFGLHDTTKVHAICYATTASDGSAHRQQIEREAPTFYDASSWSTERLVNQVVANGVHILVNLNGYTRGAKNEVFAARPAPIQMSFMGFAGTLGAEWCDYLLADKVAIPPQTLRPWRGNVDLVDQTQDGNNKDDAQSDWVYGENVIFTKSTFFCCDHRQSAPDAKEKQLDWPQEQQRRWKMRKELFPDLADNAIILGNFNQLYKVRCSGSALLSFRLTLAFQIEPTTFRAWLRILSRVPKAVLWLLRFPDLGEQSLRQTALLWAGDEVASRIIFTDVAPKHQHISRARVCDLFLDTPECNAHTTAADVLWSGTPLLTFPRYEYKMCSRMAASILRGALPESPEGDRAFSDLTVSSDDAYEERGVELASGLVYQTRDRFPPGRASGRLFEIRRVIYESRWTSPLFDTRRWVRDLETAYGEAWYRWVNGGGGDIWL